MRRSEIFLQMVATQHLDQHWSRDLQVWVRLLPPPPLQCGQGPQPGTPWRVCHPTAARESDSSARGCWDDRISAPGKAVRNIIVLSLFRQKRYIFASYLSSQVTAMLVTFCQWCVWYLAHKPALLATSYIQKVGHKIAALSHAFVNYKHQFNTDKIKIWVQNCCIFCCLTPNSRACDICLVQFHFNVMCKSFERHAKHE